MDFVFGWIRGPFLLLEIRLFKKSMLFLKKLARKKPT